MHSSHDGFLIKKRKPLVKWFILLILLGLLTVAFFVGQQGQRDSLVAQQSEIIELKLTVVHLEQRNDELVKKNARLFGDSKVDRDAFKEAKASLVEIQQEISALKEELAFYRSVVTPAETEFSVNIQTLKIQKIDKENAYRYKLVLTKSGRTSYNIKGKVKMSLTGLFEGKEKSYPLTEVETSKKANYSYNFRYFQVIQGEFMLPLNFYPEQVRIEVNSKTKKVKSLKDSFNWADLTSEEI